MTKNSLYTALALLAFAANSVLCRLALGTQSIDAGNFTIIRLLSGCITLIFIVKANSSKQLIRHNGKWSGASMLFLYAVAFSFAYLSLSTATGALILFGAVQLTLLALTFFTGFKLSPLEWLGLLLACFGFTYLMLPGINAPSVSGFLLMTLAGIAWGGYTFLGRSSTQPLLDTAANFTRTLPLAIIILIFILLYGKSHLTTQGVVLAIASGSVASGIGYAIWYKALASLSTTQAGIVQLLVPVIAAFGGVIFVSEPVTMRLLIASFLILGGIACVFFSKYFYNKN